MISDEQAHDLASIARAVLPRACAEFSGFHVGAALLTVDADVYTGVNIESSSYGATICAERTALVKALSEGEREFTAIMIVSDSPQPIMPCGICRQLLFDYAPDLLVLSEGGGEIVRVTLRELLPGAFVLRPGRSE